MILACVLLNIGYTYKRLRKEGRCHNYLLLLR